MQGPKCFSIVYQLTCDRNQIKDIMNKSMFFFLPIVPGVQGGVIQFNRTLGFYAYPLRHHFCTTAYEAAEGSSALLLMCWWSEKEQFLISARKILSCRCLWSPCWQYSYFPSLFPSQPSQTCLCVHAGLM